MNHLLAIAVQNTIVAGLLAVLVYGLTRVWCRPPVAHILWLLVLAKLIGPPILPTDWLRPGSRDPLHDPHNGARELPVGPQAAFTAVAHPSVGHEPAADAAARRDSDTEPIASSNEAAAVGRWTELFEIGTEYVQLYSDELREGVLFMWLAGLAVCGSITLYRVLRFDRMLRGTLVAPQKSQAIAAQLAQKLQLRRVPDLRLAEGCSVPLVWCFGRRPIVVLPTRLVRELDDQQTAMVLAHELAHLRRRDHWIRVAEIVIATAYWWNPLVWWVRRQLHQVEELCCDAWVDWIIRTPESVMRRSCFKPRRSSVPHLARRRWPVRSRARLPLKNRIETLLEGHLSRHVSRKTALALAGVAALLLPSFAHSARPAETGSSLGTGESATKSAPPRKSCRNRDRGRNRRTCERRDDCRNARNFHGKRIRSACRKDRCERTLLDRCSFGKRGLLAVVSPISTGLLGDRWPGECRDVNGRSGRDERLCPSPRCGVAGLRKGHGDPPADSRNPVHGEIPSRGPRRCPWPLPIPMGSRR